MTRLGLIGCGGHARELAWYALRSFGVERIASGVASDVGTLFRLPPGHFVDVEPLPTGPDDTAWVLAFGDPVAREALATKLDAAGVRLWKAPIVFCRSDVATVMGRKPEPSRDPIYWNAGADVRDFAHVLAGARIHHDAVVREFAFVGPGALVLGGAQIGRAAYVGAHATILPRRVVGDRAVVGAGAVVTHDIPSGQTWAGNPARPIDPADPALPIYWR